MLIGERDPMDFHQYSLKWLEDKNKKIEEFRSFEKEKEKSFSPIRRADTPPGYQSILTDWESRVHAYYEKKHQQSEFFSHTPEINSLSKAMLPVWNEKVEDRLMRLNAEKQEKLEEMRKRAETDEMPTFYPNTNNFNKERPNDVTFHLYQEGLSMIEKKKKAAELCSNNFSFFPVINENSRVLVANRKPKVNNEVIVEVPASRVLKPEEFEGFLERNYKIKKKEELGKEEMNEVYQKKIGKSNLVPSSYEKQMKKMIEKEQKRLEIIRARQESELEDCTFRPKVINRLRTPPPVMKTDSENMKKFKYCKTPSNIKETFKYSDNSGKIYQLKAFFHLDSSFLLSLEELERKVMKIIK